MSFDDEQIATIWNRIWEKLQEAPDIKLLTEELRAVLRGKFLAELQSQRAVAVKMILGYAREVSPQVEGEVRRILRGSEPNVLELAARHIDAAREKP